MRWHLLHSEPPLPGWRNMARDEALLDLAVETGDAWLRLYRWDPACLSFGTHEPALRRYDRERIAALGLDTVRRPTGGRAVWHDAELTYAVAAPAAAYGGLGPAYRDIHAMFARALSALGIDADPAPRPARAAGLGTGACFARPAGGELLAGGGKVLGSAQLARGPAFLQHGSLLLDGSQYVVTGITRDTPPPAGDTTLSRVAGRPIPWEDVARAVVEAAAGWHDGWTVPDDGLLAREDRYHAKYRSPDWTWRR